MQITYNSNYDPFDEIVFIERYNQLIVRKIHPTTNQKYICNFHFHSNRGAIKTIIESGMDFLFDIEKGVYNITLEGSNEENFSIVFKKLPNEGNKAIETTQISFSIEP